jgi:hypothetical protein
VIGPVDSCDSAFSPSEPISVVVVHLGNLLIGLRLATSGGLGGLDELRGLEAVLGSALFQKLSPLLA